MSIRFTVGQIAKLAHLSKQTLIYYDREGVFSPSFTDPRNGYRYYTADQLEVLDSILILKEIGLSLAEIRRFMEERSGENTLTVLRNQHGRLTEKLRSLSLVAGRLSKKIETLEHFRADGEEPGLIYLPQPQPLIAQRISASGGLLETDLALKKLFWKAQSEQYSHFYQIGTMIPLSSLLAEQFLDASYTFFPLEQDDGKDLLYRPKGWYVRCFHKGTYESVGNTYRRMLLFLAGMGCRPCGDSYEYCILDSLTSKYSEEYVTEICLPFCKENGSMWEQAT